MGTCHTAGRTTPRHISRVAGRAFVGVVLLCCQVVAPSPSLNFVEPPMSQHTFSWTCHGQPVNEVIIRRGNFKVLRSWLSTVVPPSHTRLGIQLRVADAIVRAFNRPGLGTIGFHILRATIHAAPERVESNSLRSSKLILQPL